MPDSEPQPNITDITIKQKEGLAFQEEEFDKLRKDLGSFRTLNWERILASLQVLNLGDSQKEELANLAIGYIQGAFKNGNFENLKGMEPVMQFLAVDSIEFSSDYRDRIFELYEKYSLPFLYSMSPTLWDGKLRGGEPYDKIKYTRELLQKDGASSEEITDEYIQQLWDLREVLVKMHYNFRGQDIKALADADKKLTGLVKLLEPGSNNKD